jgi:hypothetical protein
MEKKVQPSVSSLFNLVSAKEAEEEVRNEIQNLVFGTSL